MAFRWLVLGFVATTIGGCKGDDKGGGGGGADDSGGYVTPPVPIDADADLDGMTEAEGDCDDGNPGVYQGATEICDGIDNNCDLAIDEGLARVFFQDLDGDGFGNAGSPMTDECRPQDGYVLQDGDCDDTDAAINPHAAEICDDLDVDEDCNKLADENDPELSDARSFYADVDGDGYGDETSAATVSCDQPAGSTVTNNYDCNDGDAGVNPSIIERCDGNDFDDDCDGLVDDADPESPKDDYWPDADADGYGNETIAKTTTCFDISPSGYVLNGDDCNDADDAVNPGMVELCSDADVDEDCDGDIDEGDNDTTTTGWYVDDDDDGYGLTGSSPIVTCQVLPGRAPRTGDCDDTNAVINAGMDEVCDDDDIDDDCDGKVDELDAETPPVSQYVDVDGDGYGDMSTVIVTCEVIPGRTLEGGDCDDTDPVINPTATDDCHDGVDNDCDGVADNCSIGDISVDDADLTVNGALASAESGTDVADVGDLNGDGVHDLGIGTYKANSSMGQVGIFLMPMTGTTTTADSSFDLIGESSYAYMGFSIAGEADVNDDGNDDILVGAYDDDRAYLFYGPLSADETGTTADAIFTSAAPFDYLGESVDLVGDWNGDGFDEVVVMAPYAERVGYFSSGIAYVFEGPVSGTLSASAADYILAGNASYDYLSMGTPRAAVGDMDGDGLDEIALSAPYKSSNTGTVYVLTSDGVPAGTSDISTVAEATITGPAAKADFGYGIAERCDYNGDGYMDLAASAYAGFVDTTSGGLTYVLEGPISGAISVATTYDARWEGQDMDFAGQNMASGDINGDGNSDLLIGAYQRSGSLTDNGGAYVALGPLSGVHSLADSFATLEGNATGMQAGWRVDFLQDVDGDGQDEVALSANLADGAASPKAGATYMFLGGSLFE